MRNSLLKNISSFGYLLALLILSPTIILSMVLISGLIMLYHMPHLSPQGLGHLVRNPFMNTGNCVCGFYGQHPS